VVTVRTWLSELHSRSLTFSYAIVLADEAGRAEQTLVTGFSKLICTDCAGQVHRLPEELHRALQAVAS
jgi:acyl-CoA thioesterase FadM